jgi:hypothetical protein
MKWLVKIFTAIYAFTRLLSFTSKLDYLPGMSSKWQASSSISKYQHHSSFQNPHVLHFNQLVLVFNNFSGFFFTTFLSVGIKIQLVHILLFSQSVMSGLLHETVLSVVIFWFHSTGALLSWII